MNTITVNLRGFPYSFLVSQLATWEIHLEKKMHWTLKRLSQAAKFPDRYCAFVS